MDDRLQPAGGPGQARTPAPGHRGPLAGSVRTAAAAAVTGVALVGLVVGAVHGVRAASSAGSAVQVALADEDDAYYACLTTQAHHLVRPGESVDISRADLGAWATLGKVVAPWTVVTNSALDAGAVLSLRTTTGPGACLGTVVVAQYPNGAVRTGSGASLPGSGPPPSTPL